MTARRLIGRQPVALNLPGLTGAEALVLVEILDRCSAELWRRYGNEIIEALADASPTEESGDD